MVNGGRNFRWNYIRSGYLICLTRDGKDDWFLISAPKRSHKGLSVTATITCQHICAQLNKKNLWNPSTAKAPCNCAARVS